MTGEDEVPSTTHTEYGVLITTKVWTRLEDTYLTDFAAEQSAMRIATNIARGFGGDDEMVTIVKRQVTYTLGEWEPVDA